jgi:outer membrane murein-binding lipoprotein Lpp
MEQTIEKLNQLHKSVQSLESALQEVWSQIEELEEDDAFRDLKKQAKAKKHGENVGDLIAKLAEYENSLEEIPEDGTAAVDLEDAISELIEWIKENS